MIVVDTNVVSELARQAPDANVVRWFEREAATGLALSATIVAEILAGVYGLPDGRRRADLETRIEATIVEQFGDRVIPFDVVAARAYAHVLAVRRRAGRPISMGDAQIAAVCLVHDATLATRNTRDFEGCGIGLVNPWAK